MFKRSDDGSFFYYLPKPMCAAAVCPWLHTALSCDRNKPDIRSYRAGEALLPSSLQTFELFDVQPFARVRTGLRRTHALGGATPAHVALHAPLGRAAQRRRQVLSRDLLQQARAANVGEADRLVLLLRHERPTQLEGPANGRRQPDEDGLATSVPRVVRLGDGQRRLDRAVWEAERRIEHVAYGRALEALTLGFEGLRHRALVGVDRLLHDLLHAAVRHAVGVYDGPTLTVGAALEWHRVALRKVEPAHTAYPYAALARAPRQLLAIVYASLTNVSLAVQEERLCLRKRRRWKPGYTTSRRR
mmetsp:Transcript_1644/g.3559  ORF Transcript_1644/g.3559 Transcript_1644/m.3559 type:complete len:302 (+) Transcript_1644:125-1030(+)